MEQNHFAVLGRRDVNFDHIAPQPRRHLDRGNSVFEHFMIGWADEPRGAGVTAKCGTFIIEVIHAAMRDKLWLARWRWRKPSSIEQGQAEENDHNDRQSLFFTTR